MCTKINIRILFKTISVIQNYKLLRISTNNAFCRNISINSKILFKKNEQTENERIRSLTLVSNFLNSENKDKETYLDMVAIFIKNSKERRGHVEFIYTALKHMREFGVEKDVEVYKALINVMPKGKFIPQNLFQAEFMHYPKQQQCIIDLLDQMEEEGLCPDTEMETILLNIFGSHGHPLRKYWRMMYWMPKLKNISPWPIPNPPPNDGLELAKMAIKRMTSVDLQSQLKVYNTEEIADSIDNTWIVSGQSPRQQELINSFPETKSVFVEGPFILWLRTAMVNYFVLRSDPLPRPKQKEEDEDDVSNLKIPFYETPKQIEIPVSVHEQDDGIILGLCATGSSSHDSLLSWIRLLEKDGSSNLGKLPVVFRLRTSTKDISVSEKTPVVKDS